MEIKTVDINEVYDLNNRLDYESRSAENKFLNAVLAEDNITIGELATKLARVNIWKLIHAEMDNKLGIKFQIATNNDVAVEKYMSYEDICKILWWKSFKIVKHDLIHPDRYSLEERDAIEKPLIEATMKKMKKIAESAA